MEGKYLKNHKRCLSHLAKNSESIRQEVGAMQRQLGSFDKKKKKEKKPAHAVYQEHVAD